VDREYTVIEHIEKSFFGLKSQAHVAVTYEVEYSFGFDVRPASYSIARGDKNILVTLGAPQLVASPSINLRSYQILGKGIFTDEKGAIIALQQRLLPVARRQALVIAREPAVIAVCEKRFGDFLMDFMGKQPGVKFVPAVQFAYK